MATTKKTVSCKNVTIQIDTGTSNTLLAKWKFSAEKTSYIDHYEVYWLCDKGQGWYSQNEDVSHSPTEYQSCTFEIPDDVTRVRFKVKPVSTTYTSKSKTYHRFTGTFKFASPSIYYTKNEPPAQCDTPELIINSEGKFEASVSVPSSSTANYVQFQIDRVVYTGTNPKRTEYAKHLAEIVDNTAKFVFSKMPQSGKEYVCRCRGLYRNGPTAYYYQISKTSKSKETNTKKVNYTYRWGEWCDGYSSSVTGAPAVPTFKSNGKTYEGFKKLYAKSSSSIVLRWNSVDTAESYNIKYVPDNYEYFTTNTDNVSSQSVEAYTLRNGNKTYITETIIAVESGHTYYFKIQSVDSNGSVSAWSNRKQSVTIGLLPEAPTTWSMTSTVTVGDDVPLYWIHNAQDGSAEIAALVYIKDPDGIITKTKVSNDKFDDEDHATDTQTTTLSATKNGKYYWQVRTRGVASKSSDSEEGTGKVTFSNGTTDTGYGPFSTLREIDAWENPSISVNTPLEMYYYLVSGLGYEESAASSIVEKMMGDSADANSYMDEFSSYPLCFSFEAEPEAQTPITWNIKITANQEYTTLDQNGMETSVAQGDYVFNKTYTATNSFGDLQLESTNYFNILLTPSDVTLEETIPYTLTVTTAMNSGLTATFTHDFSTLWTDEDLNPDAKISDIDLTDYSINIIPTCESSVLTSEQISMSVYRNEYDGSFTEIMSNISPNYTLRDDHPALDFARYRIIARSLVTGTQVYTDIECPTEVHSIIIQWDEQWRVYHEADLASDDSDATVEEEDENSAVAQSLLILQYNIDVSEQRNPDVSLASYIGRKAPVSYYGTQLDETATWNVEIPKDDSETLYALRRLSVYMGDVYVREPSGVGYWAHVTVDITQTHCELTIPVTLNITRVEGGM